MILLELLSFYFIPCCPNKKESRLSYTQKDAELLTKPMAKNWTVVGAGPFKDIPSASME